MKKTFGRPGDELSWKWDVKTGILTIEAVYRPEGNYSEFEINSYSFKADQVLHLEDLREKLKNSFSETDFKAICELAAKYLD